MAITLSKRKICICEWCHKSFTTRHDAPGRFCSRKCAARYGGSVSPGHPKKADIHIVRKCATCGKDYKTTTHQVRTRGSNYCSRECMGIAKSRSMRAAGNHNYKGGKTVYRGRNWGQQSRLALKRDNYHCQICHKKLTGKWSYGVHHIIPYREFNGDYETANQLSNLITLCRSCHAKVEYGGLPCPRPLI